MIGNKVRDVLKQRASLHVEDDFRIEECGNKLIGLLNINETDTIKFLESCSKDEFFWISEVFEDVAYNLQSKKYIECLKKIDEKYPDLNLTWFVKTAENYMK